MPKVLLDLRMVRGRLHGIARYALTLAQRLPLLTAAAGPGAPTRPGGWSFEALVSPDGPPDGLPLKWHRARASFLSPFEQLELPWLLARSGCDLFHATSFSLPLLWPGPVVATLHDANHLDRADDYGLRQRAYYAAVVRPRARAARGLLTVSQFSRNALAAGLHLSADRLQVIAPGVDARFRPAASDALLRFRREQSLPDRYLLAVGNDKAFKNLALLARIAPRLPHPLVLLAGADAAARGGFPPSTRALAEVTESHLPLLYAGADALLLPSRYEGFGLPALEAMACGCPVIAASAGALPEVVGDAGVLLDPDDDAAWIAAAQALDGSRAALASAGIARAATFTWERCARETLSAYARALEPRA